MSAKKKAGKIPREKAAPSAKTAIAPELAVQELLIVNLKPNPTNPRVLRDEKFLKLKSSIQSFPDMLNKRPIKCVTCGCKFTSRKACRSRAPKFCTKTCYANSLVKPKLPKHPAPSRRGVPLSAEWRKALSDGRKASDKCKGPNLYNWKGGEATYKARTKAHGLRRYSRMKDGGDMPHRYLSALRHLQQGRCFYCEGPMKEGRGTHLEHMTPLTKGGSNEWHNLVYACQSCNNSKRQNTLMEFAMKRMRPDWVDKSILLQSTAQRMATR